MNLKGLFKKGKSKMPKYKEVKGDERTDKGYEVTVAPDGSIYYTLDGRLHREGGPAIIWRDGYKAWWLNGEYHRTDGPAIIWPNGSKEWFLNSKRHREDGPAIIWRDGYKAWYLNNKLHREDGPAIVYPDGEKAWYLNGKRVSKKDFTLEMVKQLNASELFTPAELSQVENKDDVKMSLYKEVKWDERTGKGYEVTVAPSGTTYYTLDGNLHREDGPAIIDDNGYKAWFLNGKRHREDGPAVIWPNGTKYWWLNGKVLYKEDFTSIEMVKQLDASELFTPAELSQVENKDDVKMSLYKEVKWDERTGKGYDVFVSPTGITYYTLDGEFHREDSPAVIHPDGSEFWYLNGKLHREDGPAIIRPDGSKEWLLNSKRHREDGPAIIFSDGHKEWYLNGKLHREDGPAVIYPSGIKEWWLNGKVLYKEDFTSIEMVKQLDASELFTPAELSQVENKDDVKMSLYKEVEWKERTDKGYEVFVGLNGNIYYTLDGKPHKKDGPAIIRPNGHKEWYLNGNLHREDGPAVIYSDGTKEWWVNGKHQKVKQEESPDFESLYKVKYAQWIGAEKMASNRLNKIRELESKLQDVRAVNVKLSEIVLDFTKRI